MKLHYLLLGVFASFTAFSSCTNEDDVIDFSRQESQIERPGFVVNAEFPEDDGAINLTGTSAQAVLNILKKTGPDIARHLGTFDITDAQYQEIKEFTDRLVAECKTEQKVYKAIFDWVKDSIRYDHGDNNPYPVFKQRYAVCQGYANLMNVMLHTQGIPVLNVNGMLNPYGGHAWNYAYVNKKWLVVDATNKGDFSMLNPYSYTHLDPMYLDCDLFADDQFVFRFSERRVTLSRVRKADDALVVPFSAGGFRVTSFCPDSLMPRNVREIYIGKNILSLGENILGLSNYGPNVEVAYVDEENTTLAGYCGAVYYKAGSSLSLCYIPSAATMVEFPPVPTMGKNYVADHKNLEEVIIAPGTNVLEPYAFENCPRLRRAYIPEETKVEANAFYAVHPNFEIVRGDYTGIPEIKM